ncbi:hypothetical protein JQ629_30905 [Bradyrhizobium sp. AUGA SZCCT0222]|uniref:hypothetical protein n=1 Tax=Bradyrhizobium sp. AUGA SZCCT0222 TaxID=2807668 RepID=UPI001BAC8ABB|nr:hypothetical protein [Bradyrhizobium sp. AUGA SZCCT0222]MBR1271903.1 hypothetical protein [Bradyrhizobium sp. AUGA SZCCT0222]
MKLVKTSAIALAISAMVAGPVLAQGAPSDSKIRGGVQGKSQMQGGTSATDDEELNAQPSAAGQKAAKTGAKGTVGAGSGAAKGAGGAAGDTATGGKRY